MKMSCPLLEFYPSFDFLFKLNHSSQVPLCAHQMLKSYGLAQWRMRDMVKLVEVEFLVTTDQQEKSNLLKG